MEKLYIASKNESGKWLWPDHELIANFRLKLKNLGKTTTPFRYDLNQIAYEYTVKVKVTQSHLTLCNSMDYTVHGILQARILQWVAIPVSRGSSQPRDQTQVSHISVRFFTS